MVRLVLKDVSFCQFSRPRLSLPADRESQTVDRYNILLFYSISLFAAPLHFSLGCPKKTKSPNFVSQQNPLVFIG